MAITHQSTILAGLLLIGVLGCNRVTGDPNAADDEEGAGKAAVTVRTEPVQRRSMIDSISALGRCEALPGKIATLTPAAEGRAQGILVSPGAEVKEGEAIVQLDPTIARADLQEKVTSREILEASLRLLQTAPRPQEQESHKLAIEMAKVSLAKAEEVVGRLHPLRAHEEVPERQILEAEWAAAQARLQLQTAESEFTAFMLGPRPEAVDEAKARIAAAAAAVNSAQAKLDLHTIHAPIAGVVDSLTCRPGQMLAAGASIGEIVDSRQVYAAVWLPVAATRRVRVGQDARVHAGKGSAARAATASMQSEPPQAETLPGKVALINRIADPQTGNLLVNILVENLNGQLTIGETLGVSIVVDRREGVLAVPAAAINDLGEGPVLHVIRQGKAVMLHPRLGMQDAGWVEVLKTDLRPGELAIVEGGYNLPEGTEVTVGPGTAEGDGGRVP